MKKIFVDVSKPWRGGCINLGHEGENNVEAVVFLLSEWQAEYGENNTCTLIVEAGGVLLEIPLLIQEGAAEYKADLEDLSAGLGEMQLRYTVGEKRKMSDIYNISINDSL